ncbi:MAG: thioesterase superfamily protein [Acidobacteriales bacterium]|nr:thioesterase superfamily protein [Terriglobales bacterium]
MATPAQPARTRISEWGDPMLTVAAAQEKISGLELLRKLMAGGYPAPPISVVLGFKLTEVDEGRAVFEMEIGEHQYNPIGCVHGGVIATLLDSAMGVAVHSTLLPGESYTTLEFKVNFTRTLTVDTDRVVSEGKIVHRGRTTAISEATVKDGKGRLYATASCTCLIRAASGG